jgi:putative sigma-54 modulation protein
MNVTITARHCELSNEQKKFIEDRVSGLSRFYEHIIEAQVIISEEKHRHHGELKININNNVFFSEAETADFRQTIDQVIQRLERQIKKHKGRFHRRTVSKEDLVSLGREASPDGYMDDMELDIMPGEGGIEEMTLNEAVKKVKAGATSLLFKDSTSGRTKSVLRRGDGRIDIMDFRPEEDG